MSSEVNLKIGDRVEVGITITAQQQVTNLEALAVRMKMPIDAVLDSALTIGLGELFKMAGMIR